PRAGRGRGDTQLACRAPADTQAACRHGGACRHDTQLVHPTPLPGGGGRGIPCRCPAGSAMIGGAPPFPTRSSARARPLAALSLGLLAAGATLTAGETPPKVQITWHGQSFFEIKSSKGTNIVIDPHSIPEYGRVLGLRADAVLMSHTHNDHTQVWVIDNLK